MIMGVQGEMGGVRGKRKRVTEHQTLGISKAGNFFLEMRDEALETLRNQTQQRTAKTF